MLWELLVAIIVALIGIGISILLVGVQPILSIVFVLGAWIELIAVITWLERRDKHQARSR